MKKLLIGALMGVTLLMATAWKEEKTITESPKIQSAEVTADSLAAERERFVKEVMETIKGKEKMPADSVFKTSKFSKVCQPSVC